jgi:hypothetical protein
LPKRTITCIVLSMYLVPALRAFCACSKRPTMVAMMTCVGLLIVSLFFISSVQPFLTKRLNGQFVLLCGSSRSGAAYYSNGGRHIERHYHQLWHRVLCCQRYYGRSDRLLPTDSTPFFPHSTATTAFPVFFLVLSGITFTGHLVYACGLMQDFFSRHEARETSVPVGTKHRQWELFYLRQLFHADSGHRWPPNI